MPNLKEASFDRVHDAQQIYRVLLHAMSRPGLVGELGEAVHGINIPEGTSIPAAALALTLLDGEVTFAMCMHDQEGWSETIRRLTYAKLVDSAIADFVFADGLEDSVEIHKRVINMKAGTLSSPEISATLLIQVGDFLTEPNFKQEGCSLKLIGPGINGHTMCYVDGLSLAWIESRSLVNVEYPMGLDMILYTKQGKVICFPRTTVVKGVVGIWPMLP